jgi:hypothetical protein
VKKLPIAAVIALAVTAAVLTAPMAYAQGPSQGDSCVNWHATTQDSNGRTLTCTHLPDSGHLMYWEYGGPQDSGWSNAHGGIGRGYKTTSGYRTGDPDDCIATGHCDPPYTGNNGQGAVGGCYYAGSPGHPEYYIGPDPCTGVPYHY